jgi:hypothetical protein
MKRECRQAERWLDDLQAGQLDTYHRARLEEHLGSCEQCSANAAGLDALVSMLRAESVESSPERLGRLWRGVLARTEEGTLLSAMGHRWHWAALALTAAVVVLAAAYLSWSRWGRPPAPKGPGARSAAIAAKRRQVRTWRLLVSNKATIDRAPVRAGRKIRPEEHLAVPAGGRAVVVSPTELVIIEGATDCSFAVTAEGASALRLGQGTINVATRRQQRSRELTVSVGEFRIRPVGTLFAVTASDGSEAPLVSVVEGRVRLGRRSSPGTTLVRSGVARRWSGASRALDSATLRRLRRDRDAGLRLAVAVDRPGAAVLRIRAPRGRALRIDGLAAGDGSATALVAAGAHRLGLQSDTDRRQPARERLIRAEAGKETSVDMAEVPPDRVGSSNGLRRYLRAGIRRGSARARRAVARRRARARSDPGRPAPARDTRLAGGPDVAARIAEIEQLLHEGRPGLARRSARALRGLLKGEAARYLPELNTLVAEAFVLEKRFRSAATAFLEVHRRFPRSSFGAHGLYMAGSIELEQLHRPRLACQRFTRYLARYRRGRSREAAYLMLWKASRGAGETGRANEAASRYVKEFPRGAYVRLLGGGSSTPRQ